MAPPLHQSETNDEPCCKVGKGVEFTGESNLDQRLADKYDTESTSLRDLEEFFNSELVSSMLRELDGDVVSRLNERVTADPEELAHILSNGDGATLARVEGTLEEGGVDVDELTDRFVSYRTMKNHLNDCLEVDTSRDKVEPLSVVDAQTTVEWSMSRHDKISSRTVKRLAQFEDGLSSNITVQTTTKVTCETCGVKRPIDSYMIDGCDCQTT